MNTITIELCAEDRARLDAILAALSGRPDCAQCAQISAAYAEELRATRPAQKDEHPVADPFPAPEAETPAAPQEEPQTDEEDEEDKPVTHDDIRSVFMNAGENQAKVREIIQQYAKKISDIPVEKLGEVMKKLEGVCG